MKLTVIIPVYNQENLIKIGLSSIPPRDDIEVIIIDDGSTDGTYNEIRNYQLSSKKNVMIISNFENLGVARSVNKGIDYAFGEYIVLLGADGDYFVNLDKGMEYLDGTDLIYFPLEINSGKIWNPRECAAGSCKFMRREFIGETRNPILKNCEDNEFYKLLKLKNPTEKFLTKEIMYKHYNYPRKGSLVWEVENGLSGRGEEL